MINAATRTRELWAARSTSVHSNCKPSRRRNCRATTTATTVVDAADYVIWRKTKGADVPQYAGADGNGSSKIDDADYDVWRGHFGAPSSASAAAADPQSSSITAEAQPDATQSHRNDSALIAEHLPHRRSSSANLIRTIIDRLRKDQVSRPMNQHARDEALLAITTESLDGPNLKRQAEVLWRRMT